MRHPIAKIATLALVAPLAGATFLSAAPASAAPVAVKAAATKADDPWSVFKVAVAAPKKVRAGGKITYTILATNKGPESADVFFMGGKLPKNISGKVSYVGPKGTKCKFYVDGFWCWTPYILEKDDYEVLKIQVKLKKNARGVAVAKLGALSADIPRGAENLDRERLKELGIKSYYWWKTVKTKIVR
jgi:uncharacterized repeat protein (TIGR01451 family)